MLTQQQVEQFHRDGFLNGGRILDDGEINELRSELFALLDKGPDGFAPGEPRPVLFRNLSGDENAIVWQIVNIWEACPSFRRLLYHPRVVSGISQLTGTPDLMIWHDQVQYKPAGKGGTTNWHQDAPLWPTILPMTPVSAWIPFDDADEQNGCMSMVPGSHKWGNCMEYLGKQPKEKFFEIGRDYIVPAGSEIKEAKSRPWPVKKGEVSFHHSLTWHGSPSNTSVRPRPAIAIHYMTGEARFVGRRGHPMEQFINLPDNAPMAQAGDHFPAVCRGGKPLGIPEELRKR